jgi:ABC-type transport system involved in multi-copper enzyme maturation permease subunit
MGKLLKLEWLKIRKYRAFMTLVILGVVSIFGLNYMVYSNIGSIKMEQQGGVDLVGMAVGTPFAFPEVWQTASFLSAIMLFMSGVVIILLMSNEYTFRTARQSVIDGVSRRQFIDTKIALLFITALILSVVVFLTGLILGLLGTEPFSLDGAEFLGYFFVRALSFMSVAMVIVMLLKRSGVSIGIYLLYLFVVERLVGLILNKTIWDGAGLYLPLRSSSKLIPAPGYFGEVFETGDIDPLWYLAVAVVWIVACLAFCRWHFQKSDL